MEEKRDEVGPSEKRRHGASWWPSGFVGKFGHVSLDSKELYSNTSNDIDESSRSLHQTASQILWSTGMLSQPIPNGFYSVVPEKRLKETFEEIPSLDELLSLELEGVRADVILVDVERDKKLSKLKQLILALVKGLNSNPASVIKKIAGLVSDCYKRQFSELSPANAQHKGTFHAAETKGAQMLGQIKQGSCRPRAILFKVLADTVGLDSRLIAGLPAEGNVECLDSHKHMSVMVVLNSVELLVDLMRFPGQLRPLSTKALVMAHVSVARERDFAENDSCDSPLEPNSPLCGFSEKADHESSEKDDNLQYHRRLEASLNVAGTSLRNKIFRSNTFVDRKMSSSHQSEPNIANTSWRRSRREIIAEQRTASSSPEHPSAQARERSMLSGDNKTFRGFSDDIATSRSEGASASETCRIRRRSISMIPEIGDDIARAVRAMNEALKQNRFSRVEGENSPFSYASDERSGFDNPKNGSDFHHDDHDIDSSTGGSSIYSFQRDHINSQKAISLPSSPHEYMGQTPERSGISNYRVDEEMVATWNQILRSPTFQNKPLLPYEEWNIDFSELVVGTRVGIGFFGEVFRGTWNGTDVAIKVFLEQDLTTENMEDFCNEITILSRLRHPNVILFLGACTRPPRLSMITEYMEMGSLYFLIHLSGQKKKLSIRRRLKMLRDICRGLLCIHRMKIIHCDIKSANCLVNKHWTVKICDFGLSRIMTDDVMNDSSSAGTPEWMAPELIRNQPFNEKCDIFSLGVIMWELCTLNRPWDGVPPERVVYSVANEGSRLEIPEGPLGRLISDCWAEPHERPSCEDILVRLIECENTLC